MEELKPLDQIRELTTKAYKKVYNREDFAETNAIHAAGLRMFGKHPLRPLNEIVESHPGFQKIYDEELKKAKRWKDSLQTKKEMLGALRDSASAAILTGAIAAGISDYGVHSEIAKLPPLKDPDKNPYELALTEAAGSNSAATKAEVQKRLAEAGVEERPKAAISKRSVAKGIMARGEEIKRERINRKRKIEEIHDDHSRKALKDGTFVALEILAVAGTLFGKGVADRKLARELETEGLNPPPQTNGRGV